MARLVSVNVGLPRDVAWKGETVRTAIWKQPSSGRKMVRLLNIDGDGQGDLAGHGGLYRAVMVYQTDSYRYWESQLRRNDFAFGQFGENFTVDGLSDDEVCIGDRYRIGSALFEVTQPRVTCYRVGIRMAEPTMAALLVAHHRPGFYLRVLEEGEVGAGDEIVKTVGGPERITVAAMDKLLYLPGRSRDHLESALRIPALSPGWKSSFQAMLVQVGTGNAGLAPSAGPPAWTGFRSLRVAKVDRESANVISLSFESPDGSPLPAAMPGQFLGLRLHLTPDGPTLLRNYSLSGKPGAAAYRISVKNEPNGAASSFLHSHIRAGDVLEVSAPRGTFTLQPGDGPVVLVSAGIGATPVLAMLHSLASIASHRRVYWVYGTRNRTQHPFAGEARGLLKSLPGGQGHIVYSRPGPEDQPGVDFDSTGHLDTALLDQLQVPRNAEFYLCGPAAFLRAFTESLKQWSEGSARVYSEVFGPEDPITPGIQRSSRPLAHVPSGPPGKGPQISFTRSGITAPWDSRFQSLLEFAEACDVPVNWSCRTGVCHTCECALIAGTVSYQPVPLDMPADGNVLICCSQPAGELEIDL
jgi:ferredoxin-NADP reductase/MOSC domain-containing protein YiiM